MKTKLFKILFALFVLCSDAMGQVTISNFPENLQLFVRNEKNYCDVKISGNIVDTSYSVVILKLFKNDSLKLEAISSPLNFNFSIPISAELSEYSFELYSQKGMKVSLEKKSEKVLCGDVLLLTGQSNMVAIPGIDDFNAEESDKYMRNFDFRDSEDTTTTKWYTAKHPYAQVGTLANYLMKNLVDSLKIPFLTINQSVGGATINWMLRRNPENHFDKKYNYGKMLTRLKESKVLDKIKYIAFYHGESAAATWYLDCEEYPGYFRTFVSNLREDLPTLKKFYEFQINILMISPTYNYNQGASFLREFQRQTKNLYPGFIETISTVGTENYYGIHYQKEGYISMALRLSRLIQRDFYGRIKNDGIEHPDVQNAYYSPTKDSITLVFQQRQNVSFPAPINFGNYTRYMQNYFYLTRENIVSSFNQTNTPVMAGSGNENKITLKLNGPQNSKYITYLPTTFTDTYSSYYDGPHLYNQKNLKAFSFYCLPIDNFPPAINLIPKKPQNLVASGVSSSQINISWRDVSENEAYFSLESSLDSVNFKEIYNGNATWAVETGISHGNKRYYRIKSCNSNGCSDYSYIISAFSFEKINYNCLNFQYEGILRNFRKKIIAKKIMTGATHYLSEIKLEAGELIVLNPGFSFTANSGKTFEAMIEGCQ